jgi:hypothetical protein
VDRTKAQRGLLGQLLLGAGSSALPTAVHMTNGFRAPSKILVY